MTEQWHLLEHKGEPSHPVWMHGWKLANRHNVVAESSRRLATARVHGELMKVWAERAVCANALRGRNQNASSTPERDSEWLDQQCGWSLVQGRSVRPTKESGSPSKQRRNSVKDFRLRSDMTTFVILKRSSWQQCGQTGGGQEEGQGGQPKHQRHHGDGRHLPRQNGLSLFCAPQACVWLVLPVTLP